MFLVYNAKTEKEDNSSENVMFGKEKRGLKDKKRTCDMHNDQMFGYIL